MIERFLAFTLTDASADPLGIDAELMTRWATWMYWGPSSRAAEHFHAHEECRQPNAPRSTAFWVNSLKRFFVTAKALAGC